MDIVISFDENYSMPAGVMLTSLFENNKDSNIHIHVLLNGSGKFVQPIIDIVNRYHGKISFYDLSDYDIPNLPVNLPNQRANISVESYYRLFMSDILPAEIDKALWLDCDIIVAGDLKELWNEDISDCAVGVVPDFENNNVHIMNRLGYDATYGYFNAGVLLINLKYWKTENVIPVFANYISNNYEKLFYHDQDVLNYVFHDQKKELNVRYNFQTTFLYRTELRNFSCKYFAQVDSEFKSPCIIHFTDNKPWFKGTINPLKGIFYKYQSLTIWKGLIIKKKKSLKTRLYNIALCIKYRKKTLMEVFYDSKYIQAKYG